MKTNISNKNKEIIFKIIFEIFFYLIKTDFQQVKIDTFINVKKDKSS